ncbi:MAG: hypothetical protein PF637_10965 [Spirochaetes bacterium]|jgi:hypothetical protein|nr:hypothetical protein [Spirochaetota bacterium]
MRDALKIAGLYLLVSVIWIISSDKVTYIISQHPDSLIFYSTVKGIFFITATSLFIFYLSYQQINRRTLLIEKLNEELKIKKELIRELHHRIMNNLQVVISLFSNETQTEEFPENIRNRLLSKLFSLKSVFTIVYYTNNMNNLNFGAILKEYARCRPDRITIGNTDNADDFKLSVEQIVTLMVAIDLISYSFKEESVIKIDLSDNQSIVVSTGADNCEESVHLPEEEEQLLSMLLESVGSTIKIEPCQKKLLLNQHILPLPDY